MVHQIVMLSALFTGCIASTTCLKASHEMSFKLSPKGTIYLRGVGPEDVTVIHNESRNSFFNLLLINQSVEAINSKAVLVIYYATNNPQKKVLKLSKYMKIVFLKDDDANPVGSCCSVS